METIQRNSFAGFEEGKIVLNGVSHKIKEFAWSPNPAYKGVSLKHIIKGNQTGNAFSIHLVKIDPNCEIGIHNHLGKTEIHEIIDGEGYCILNEENIPYKNGIIAIMPNDVNHRVVAGDKGLYLFAKFIPALL